MQELDYVNQDDQDQQEDILWAERGGYSAGLPRPARRSLSAEDFDNTDEDILF